MAEETIQCWQCGTRMTLDELSANDGDCPECEVEIALAEYLSKALAENAALRAKAPSQGGEAVAWRVTGRDGLTVTAQYPKWAEADCLLTITPLYTHPADQVADGVVVSRELLVKLLDEGRRAETWSAQEELRALLAKP